MTAAALGPDTTMLITGFPSLSARLLLQEVLVEERTALLVVHPDDLDRAQKLSRGYAGRVRLFCGDITRLDLGLSGDDVNSLLKDTEVVLHLAECRDRSASSPLLWRLHVEATQGLLELALSMKRLKLVAAFSTVLVSGDRRGLIEEHELEQGQGFRDEYERTRYEGERRLAMARAQLPIAVFRPGLPAGDSTTGELEEMDLVYVLIRAMLELPRDVQFPFPGNGRRALNISSTSYAVQAAATILRQTLPAGETFHLTDPNPASAWHVLEAIAQAAGRERPRSVAIPTRLMRRLLNAKPLRRHLSNQREFLDHISQNAQYSCTNTRRALGDSHIECPPFDSYVHKLVNYVARN